jgi:uncharacterized membrane protein HdeD (DUF308 family)
MSAMREGQTYPDELRELGRLWWLPLGVGLLSIAAGVVVLLKPSDSLTTIAVVVGVFVAVDGALALIASLQRRTENRGLAALMGVVGLVVGVLLIRHPVTGVTAVAVLFGIWLIAVGAVRFVVSFEQRERRAWRIVISVVEMAAGIVIVSVPHVGLATLAILVGVSLIANGASLAVLGVLLRNATRDELTTPHRPAPAV